MIPATLIVMAAGIGSRYGGLKQIEPVGPSGEILLDYAIYDALRVGFQRFVFVIRREIEADFRTRMETRWGDQPYFDYVYQELLDMPLGFTPPPDRPKPWGTGHAVYACRTKVSTRFGVINADDFYGPASFRLLAQHLEFLPTESSDAILVGFLLRNTLSEHGPVARGVCEIDAQGRLRKIVECPKVEQRNGEIWMETPSGPVVATGEEVVSMNLWGFTSRWFEHFERDFALFLQLHASDRKAEFMLPVVVDNVIQRELGTVRTVVSPERWMGVTYAGDRAVVAAGVSELIRRGLYPPRIPPQ